MALEACQGATDQGCTSQPTHPELSDWFSETVFLSAKVLLHIYSELVEAPIPRLVSAQSRLCRFRIKRAKAGIKSAVATSVLDGLK